MMIEVEGKKYKVIEKLGYVHDIGKHCAIVIDGERERTVIKNGKTWKFAKPLILPRSDIRGQ